MYFIYIYIYIYIYINIYTLSDKMFYIRYTKFTESKNPNILAMTNKRIFLSAFLYQCNFMLIYV